MRIPKDVIFNWPSEKAQRLIKNWNASAEQIEIEFGIYVKVDCKYNQSAPGTPMTEIFFKIDDHEFGSLNELKRALKLKSFL